MEEGLPLKPIATKPEAKSNALEEWKEKEMQNMKALQLLQMVVTDLVLMKVVSATTSQEIWKRLQETYQGNDQAHSIHLP